jgi:hypothetical protein
VKLPHHFTGQFGNPMDAAQESGTWGDKAKPLAAYRRRLCCLGRRSILRVIKAGDVTDPSHFMRTFNGSVGARGANHDHFPQATSIPGTYLQIAECREGG